MNVEFAERNFGLTVRVRPDELDGGYISEVVEVPGARSQGETTEEAVLNAIDAAICILTAGAQDKVERVVRERPNDDTYRLALA